jgi:multiple sugar transport system permease protein
MIRPAVVIVIIFRTMIALRAFAAIFSATGGGPGTATEILNLYTYRESFNSLNLGYGAALGTVLLIITVGISMIFFRLRQSRM